jgi:hypothetical protein
MERRLIMDQVGSPEREQVKKMGHTTKMRAKRMIVEKTIWKLEVERKKKEPSGSDAWGSLEWKGRRRLTRSVLSTGTSCP